MELLLVASVFVLSMLVLVFAFVMLRRWKVQPADIKDAVSSTWMELGLAEKIARLAGHAEDIKNSYKSFEQMLKVPSERGAFGELSLETILSDHLPPEMFGLREKVLDGKVPDANIRSSVGIICVDSKFPLENFNKRCESGDPHEKQKLTKEFVQDVRGHLDKVARDYVCPDKGSAEFTFVYIPSESVYYFLVCEAHEMLREYTKKGVQVVSPLTLSHKVELIKSGVHARKLTEEAERVHNDLIRISRGFSQLDRDWRTFYETHLRNAVGKAADLDEAYRKLRDEFDRIARFASDE